MEPGEIMASLFDKKIVKILKHFIKNEDSEFYLREISRQTNVSAASTYRILSKLAELDILEIREIKTAKLYKLKKNKIVDFLKSIMEIDVLEYFTERASKIKNVEEILLLGKKGKSKANVLILGNNINSIEIKNIISEIKEKHSFTINQMCLSREQYGQMSSMGLYPGEKKTLYRRD